MNMKFLINCDVGVLLTPNDEECHCYNKVYDRKYGYYDEDQIPYLKDDLDKAIEYARSYVNSGCDMTYAIISDQGTWNLDETDLRKLSVDGFCYESDNVVYSIAKINGNIIENFVNRNLKDMHMTEIKISYNRKTVKNIVINKKILTSEDLRKDWFYQDFITSFMQHINQCEDNNTAVNCHPIDITVKTDNLSWGFNTTVEYEFHCE